MTILASICKLGNTKSTSSSIGSSYSSAVSFGSNSVSCGECGGDGPSFPNASPRTGVKAGVNVDGLLGAIGKTVNGMLISPNGGGGGMGMGGGSCGCN
ncbi:coiled-coil family protein [Dictyostelium discoideum AX4]|uniref:HssA/B-like protein 27 n=1 Tax=Dictyostelium discoideum TaxID=44689 RepID=HSL27_DICDI|nr:coiled-coil family protein [Dictyostelium discoideum AX4]P15649.2 RecName: Full=HssA/B-like protein 27; AltName: Full=Protein 7E [Dictyostelium discoideum]EAL69469.1 coiled-coil family protein [Dictyostelium discoideum AX4]|eukprot:XP_643415.1 coiled-coil family protein [Dictyostelium discoideum AX4]